MLDLQAALAERLERRLLGEALVVDGVSVGEVLTLALVEQPEHRLRIAHAPPLPSPPPRWTGGANRGKLMSLPARFRQRREGWASRSRSLRRMSFVRTLRAEIRWLEKDAYLVRVGINLDVPLISRL